jgi:hypothetical protein
LAGEAEAIVRATCGMKEAELRVSYLKALLRESELGALASSLDALCARAQQAEPDAREVLMALVDAIQDPTLGDIVRKLRDEAARVPLLALERVVRYPSSIPSPEQGAGPKDAKDSAPHTDHVPDYGRGRTLTLGERKALARMPTRDMTERLLRDPHPDVIRRLLVNPKITEDDVLTLAVRRPGRPEVLAEIARTPRWMHRPRIRMALVLNPGTPMDVGAPLVGLLVRQELELVATSPKVAPALRALCLEHLERRPPVPTDPNGSTWQ